APAQGCDGALLPPVLGEHGPTRATCRAGARTQAGRTPAGDRREAAAPNAARAPGARDGAKVSVIDGDGNEFTLDAAELLRDAWRTDELRAQQRQASAVWPRGGPAVPEL